MATAEQVVLGISSLEKGLTTWKYTMLTFHKKQDKINTTDNIIKERSIPNGLERFSFQ